jgi:hypothetical protein
MRLVLPDPSNLQIRFPIEKSAQFSPEFAGVPLPLRRRIAEISRFAILHRFLHHQPRRAAIHYECRRMPRYGAQVVADNEPQQSRLCFPYTMLVLSARHDAYRYPKRNNTLVRNLDSESARVVMPLQSTSKGGRPSIPVNGARRPHVDSIRKNLPGFPVFLVNSASYLRNSLKICALFQSK